MDMRRTASAVAAIVFTVVWVAGPSQALGAPTLISTDKNGNAANDQSGNASISTAGGQIAFASDASDLINNLTDEKDNRDVFYHDVSAGNTYLVSYNSHGKPANGDSDRPSISANGEYVVFQSKASNLVADDNNDASDVFLWTRATGIITRVSTSRTGRNANGPSGEATISGDGSVVVYASDASNMQFGDDNDKRDIYLWTRADSINQRISTDTGGGDANGDSGEPAISGFDVADPTHPNRYVVFHSTARDLVASDDNGNLDLFFYDRVNGSILKISNNTTGGDANGLSGFGSISNTGRFVVYVSSASNLMFGDNNGFNDIFLWDKSNGSNTKKSNSTVGGDANGNSYNATICGPNTRILFESFASNMVLGDDNGTWDIFSWDTDMEKVTTSYDGQDTDKTSANAEISRDCNVGVFQSKATNIILGEPGSKSWDVFRRPL